MQSSVTFCRSFPGLGADEWYISVEILGVEVAREVVDPVDLKPETLRGLVMDAAYRHGLYIADEGDIATGPQFADWYAPELTDEAIDELGTITTRDAAGRHFVETSEHWETLEAHGLIRVDRPRHKGNGLLLSREHWTVEVTERGQQVVTP